MRWGCGKGVQGQSPAVSGRHGGSCAPKVGSEQEFQQRMGGTQLEEWVQASLHSACTRFFNKPKAEEFAELRVHECGFQTEPLCGFAGGEGFLGFQETQALHPDGGKGRTSRGARPRGEQGQDGACTGDGIGGGLGGVECLGWGGGVIVFGGGGPRAVDGMGDPAQEVLDLFGEFAVHGGLPP